MSRQPEKSYLEGHIVKQPPLSSCLGTHLLLSICVFIHFLHSVLDPSKAAGEAQQQAHHLLQITNEHHVALVLIGFTQVLNKGLQLLATHSIPLSFRLDKLPLKPQSL